MKRSYWLAIFLPFGGLLVAQEEKVVGHPSLSPDKKWEYRVSEESAVLVKSGSGETVVDLAEEIGGLATESGEVLWAPDSRCFAFDARKWAYVFANYVKRPGDRWRSAPALANASQPSSGAVQP